MMFIQKKYFEHREKYLKAFPKIKAYFEGSKARFLSLKIISKYMTWGMYGAYALLLVLCFMKFSVIGAVECIILPFAVFLVTTVVRDKINAPRPYELSQMSPVFPKSTKGHSCPSRHTACAFAVALAWCSFDLPVGIVLLICASLIGASRSLVGVHFPLDVLFGAIIALAVNTVQLFI